MSSVRCLLCADPVATWNPATDTSLRLAEAIKERGWVLDYCDLSKADWRLPTAEYLSQIPVREVLRANHEREPYMALGAPRAADVNEYAVILQRKDPPVDEIYRGHAAHYAQASKKILQLNAPKPASTYSEKQLPLRFPDYCTPTTVCRSLESFVAAVRSQQGSLHGEAVAKPNNMFAGHGVEFFRWDAPEAELKRFWQREAPVCVVQPFLKEIETIGDLRILVMNQRIVGWLLRKPAPGKRLANLIHGATAAWWDPTPRQLEATQIVAKELNPEGLYLLGLDFIGDNLNEVNITCPTGVPAINRLHNKRAEVEIVDELEKLLQRS